MADNEPVNTLIEALERDITEVWSYKDQFKDADSLGLDNEKVNLRSNDTMFILFVYDNVLSIKEVDRD